MSQAFPIPVDTRERNYTATAGQTVFAADFPFQQTADVKVYHRLAAGGPYELLVEAADYTLTGAGNPSGGAVTLVSGAAVGDKIRIRGEAVLARTSSVVQAGVFKSSTLDDELDRNRIIQQEHERDINDAQAKLLRAMLTPDGETIGELPALADRKKKLMAFDADGNPTVAEAIDTTPEYPALEKRFDTVDELPSIKRGTLGDGETISVSQKDNPKRGGRFMWMADIILPHDGGVVIRHSDGLPGGFVRLNTGHGPIVSWWNAKGDGVTPDNAAFQAAANYVSSNRLGRCYVPAGKYLVAGVTYGPFCIFTALGEVEYVLPSGADTFMFKSLGFDDWADSTPAQPDGTPTSTSRSFAVHSSPAARNSVAVANEYDVGTVVVTHPTNPALSGWFVGEVWWLATSVGGSGYADADEHWTEVEPLIGAIKSGFDGGNFNGQRTLQSGDPDMLCHYGITPFMRNIRAYSAAGWAMFVETAGGTFSVQVGFSQQGTWENCRFYDSGSAAKGNLYYNGQSDTDFQNLQCYVTPNGGCDLYIGAKASGSRFHGGHVYGLGGDLTDPSPSNFAWAIKCDAQACDWSMHVEKSVWLNGARHKGFFKIYRANTISEMDSAAVWLNDPSMCELHVRSYLMLECFRIYGTDNGNNILFGQLTHRVGKTGTAVISASGSAVADSTIVFARNNINTSDNYVRIATVAGSLRSVSSGSTYVGFNAQGPHVVRNGIEQILFTGSENVNRVPPRIPSYAVASLPVAVTTGAFAFATDGRKEGEGVGAGTGVPVIFYSAAWRRVSDGQAVAT